MLRALGGSGVALLAGRGRGADVSAAGTCRADGAACAKRGQCCSGVCKKGTCVHGAAQGICTIVEQSDSNIQHNCQAPGAAFCYCFVTSRGASVCAANDGSVCARCRRNKDCTKYTGSGSFCVTFPNCGGTTNTACQPPCPKPAP